MTSPRTLEQHITRLAFNLRWIWDEDTRRLFEDMAPEVWARTRHNPVAVLRQADGTKLDDLLRDPAYVARIQEAYGGLERYLSSSETWFATQRAPKDTLIAYFSAEYGLAECLPIYAGGLGVLAGDHLKSASDLGVPLVGVGLLYRHGYFRQQVDESGWQQERYDPNDFESMPLLRVTRDDGRTLKVCVRFPGRDVYAQVWRAEVGRVSLYLLDTDVPENDPRDREITGQLYGGDLETRIQQELILGIGGYRALEALGLEPTVYHMNEGHSAFLALEEIGRAMRQGERSLGEALAAVAPHLVFTTHTPVAAGHDYFPPELMGRYFGEYAADMGVSMGELLGLGRRNPEDASEYFCMTVLALRTAGHSNGVSELHGEVSREMWRCLWPDRTGGEVPIGHVTNGVHLPTWIAPELASMYDEHVGNGWRTGLIEGSSWSGIEEVPDEKLWAAHERERRELVEFVRGRLREQLERHGASEAEVAAASGLLDPSCLTVGFARRFATYKRATLLFRDTDRLARILNHPERPIQIVFAGKAHPRDEGGKALIQQIEWLARDERFHGRIVFVEDYDLDVARHLVRGADVWLNNPKRPLEASGTSGMKAAANGVLNLSTLDGWWDEAWRSAESRGATIGWAIGSGESYDDEEYQAAVESEVLYELLECQVAPLFYERGEAGVPHIWVGLMKASIRAVPSEFNTNRMVKEYTERAYLPGVSALAE